MRNIKDIIGNKKNCIIGIDLDKTLVNDIENKPYDPKFIGEPVPLMFAIAKQLISDGHKIYIFTARVASDNPNKDISLPYIKEWCIKYFGFELKISAEKSHHTTFLLDDRAYHVEPNTGIID